MKNIIKELTEKISTFETQAYESERKATFYMALSIGLVFVVYTMLLFPMDIMDKIPRNDVFLRLIFMGFIAVISFCYAIYLKNGIKKCKSPRIGISAAIYYTIILGSLLFLGTKIKSVSVVPLFLILIGLGYSWLHIKQYIIYVTIIMVYTLIQLSRPKFDYFWLVEVIFFYFFAVSINIFQVKQKIKILEYQRQLLNDRNYDKLTELMNRRFIEESFPKYKTEKAYIATIMVDLDHFKDVNDTFGHAFGDEALKESSKIFKNVFSDEALIGRLGGDEFIIIYSFDEKDKEDFKKFLNLLINSVPIAFEQSSVSINVTFSVGCYICERKNFITLKDLVTKADKAMYQAKKEGRNKIILYFDDEKALTIQGNNEVKNIIKV